MIEDNKNTHMILIMYVVYVKYFVQLLMSFLMYNFYVLFIIILLLYYYYNIILFYCNKLIFKKLIQINYDIMCLLRW
jgi:hypothetical protein